MRGVELWMLHSEIYHRPCELCLKNAWDEEKGVMVLHGGKPVERPPFTHAPCRKPSRSTCPKGTPEQPNTLSPRSLLAWRHFQECKLTGRWPEDHWTMARYVLLADLVQRCEEINERRARAEEMQLLITAAVGR